MATSTILIHCLEHMLLKIRKFGKKCSRMNRKDRNKIYCYHKHKSDSLFIMMFSWGEKMKWNELGRQKLGKSCQQAQHTKLYPDLLQA